MTKSKAIGVACLTVALAAATTAMAQGYAYGGGGGGQGAGFARGSGAHFARGRGGLRGDGFRRSGFGSGLAAGAAVGAIVVGPGDGPGDDSYVNTGDQGYALDQWPIGDANYCSQRYRSYDPVTGTYLGSDGQRHLC
jgi:hypothetical protein